MSATNAPRYLPTLTEVVVPEEVLQTTQSPAMPQQHHLDASAIGLDETAEITQQVLNKVTPAMEQLLRNSAQQLLEAQISVVLPALRRHIEVAIREAITETLARSDKSNEGL